MIRNNSKILREDTIYPGTPAYVVEITTHNLGRPHTYEAHIPKTEYKLGIHLSKMVKEGKVSEKEMKVLEALIEDYGSGKYEEALDSAAMDAAGEDI